MKFVLRSIGQNSIAHNTPIVTEQPYESAVLIDNRIFSVHFTVLFSTE